MLRLAWGMALAATVVALTGILTLTADLAVTDAVFADGVVQAAKVDETTDKALEAGLELPAADAALGDSMSEVLRTIDSLQRVQGTLGRLGSQLTSLGSVLASADDPLASIIGSTRGTTAAAGDARNPVNHIVDTLAEANGGVGALGPKLDRTLAHSRAIESKLRVLLLLPGSDTNG